VDIFHPVKTTGPPYELDLGENLWPETPGDFRAIVEKYIADLVFLETEVVRALALTLDVDEKIFTSRIKEPFWNLRDLGYPPLPEGNIAGIREHTGPQVSFPKYILFVCPY
jgi:isopenicillin N synthase-like dioxygenase